MRVWLIVGLLGSVAACSAPADDAEGTAPMAAASAADTAAESAAGDEESAALTTRDGTLDTFTTELRLGVKRAPGSGACPGYLEVRETARIYEGGAEWSGIAWLQWLAEPFAVSATGPSKVTWSAALRPAYAACRGTAAITSVNGDLPEGSVHLTARFDRGRVHFTLDIGPYGDAVALVRSGVVRSNPSWRWAVAD